jgi:hypothetical protein
MAYPSANPCVNKPLKLESYPQLSNGIRPAVFPGLQLSSNPGKREQEYAKPIFVLSVGLKKSRIRSSWALNAEPWVWNICGHNLGDKGYPSG